MRIYLLITTLFLSLQAWAAPVVIVSDIDDTLKIAYVKSIPGSIAAAFDTTAVFRGMPALLTALAQTNQAPVYYLSNAPESRMGAKHREFLGNNAFPPGFAILRTDLDKDVHKITNLRLIARKEQPQIMILIGDNGEMDISTYDTFRREFPGIRMVTFIHTIYSKKKYDDLLALREGQLSFATPVEIYLNAAGLGLLNEPAARAAASAEIASYLQSLSQPLGKRGPAYRREWMDFSDAPPEIHPRQRNLPGLDAYLKAL